VVHTPPAVREQPTRVREALQYGQNVHTQQCVRTHGKGLHPRFARLRKQEVNLVVLYEHRRAFGPKWLEADQRTE